MESTQQDKAAEANNASSSTSSAQLNDKWKHTRESSTIPSEPSTPAPGSLNTSEDLFGRYEQSSQRSSRTNSVAAAPSSATMNVDAEDEDVKIAIIALGAMKHLDGKSRHRSESQGGKAMNSSCKWHHLFVSS